MVVERGKWVKGCDSMAIAPGNPGKVRNRVSLQKFCEICTLFGPKPRFLVLEIPSATDALGWKRPLMLKQELAGDRKQV
ncbi:hypothetical protein [Oscillatoria acuminata]|uniref:hypothetical protein n=1 Tax=Oscillatoria acuminata TaxID=118323 RepID=UPI0002DB65E0|nr:hypothetical protein [Oscillatoria acuminata]